MAGDNSVGDVLRWLLWVVCLVIWTILLLTSAPAHFAREHVNPYTNLPISKFLHIGAYAFLAALAGTLNLRHRWILLVVLALHGVMTEVLQTFVPDRSGSLRDVLIDHVGIALGVLISWAWWRSAFFKKQVPTS
jgi:VanZ family protein